METLEDIVNNEETEAPASQVETPVEPEAKPEEQQQAEPKEEQPRDEAGKFKAKGEKESASPAPVETPLDHKALVGERRRRQEAEARLAEIEAERTAEPQEPAPSVFDDEDAAWNARLEQFLPIAEQRAMAKFEENMIARSANAARAKYDDFDDAREVFTQMAKDNPMLEQQLRQSDNPGEFAYKSAKHHMELQQYGGSVDALVEARVKAELEKQKPAEQPKAPDIPESLADAQSSKTATAPTAPLSLDQILSGKR